MAKPFLYHLQDPINNSVHYACHRAIGDDRAGDLEDLGAEAEDKAFMLKFDGGAGDGIGKAGNGDDGSAAGIFAQLIIDTDGGKERAQKDHANGEPKLDLIVMDPIPQKIADPLPDATDPAAYQKGDNAIL